MQGEIFWRIGPVPLYTLGLSLALGFLTATIVAIPHMRRQGLRRRQVLHMMLAVMLFSVPGARAAALLFGGSAERFSLPSLLVIPPEGLSYFGGLLTAFLVVIVCCYKNDWQLLAVTDGLVPAAALGISVGLAVQLAADLIHLEGGGPAWLNLILFSAAYGVTWALWQRRARTRFRGELTLLLLGSDSLLRLVAGRLWVVGEALPASPRGPLVTLVIVCLLWFLLRGAALRRGSVERPDQKGEPLVEGRRATPGWISSYLLLAACIIARLYVDIA